MKLNPVGYHILVKPYKTPEKLKTQSGFELFMPDETRHVNDVGALCAQVLAMGSDAYTDKSRFPNGPWCAVGDWVFIGRNAGSRFLLEDEEYRLINDDVPMAVVESPEAVRRIML